MQSSAEVLGVTEMRAHAGAQLGLVDELVGLRAVLERRLRAQQQRVNVGRRAALQQLARERRLLGEQRGVGGGRDFRREVEARLDQRACGGGRCDAG